MRPALETNRLPATIVEEGFPAVNDVCRAFGTASRVVIGIDDALERMRTIVGGRHWFPRFARGVGLVVAGNFRPLLSAGADPYMEVWGLDTIQCANKLFIETRPLRGIKLWKDLDSKLQSKISRLRDAVEILKDWVANK